MVLRLFCNNRQSESTHPGAARDPPDQRRSTPVTRVRRTILNTSPLILGRYSKYWRVGMLHSGAKLWHIAAHFEQRRKGALWPPGGLWPSSGRQPWGRGMVSGWSGCPCWATTPTPRQLDGDCGDGPGDGLSWCGGGWLSTFTLTWMVAYEKGWGLSP